MSLTGKLVKKAGVPDLNINQDMSVMKNSDLPILVERYLNGQASEEERKLVDEWYASFDKNPGMLDRVEKKGVERAKKKSFLALRKKLNF